MWKARSGKEKQPCKRIMKARISEITQTKCPDSRGSVGFTSVLLLLWDFCSSVLPPSHKCRMWWSSFSQAGFIVAATGVAPGRPGCHSASQQGWQESRTTAISTSLLHSGTNWEPLLSRPHRCLCFSLCSCLLSAELSLNAAGLALARSPASHALEAENKLNLQPLTTSPIRVPFIPIMRNLSSPFRPAFSPFHNTEITSSKHWKFGPLNIIIQSDIGNITEEYSQLLIFALAVLC